MRVPLGIISVVSFIIIPNNVMERQYVMNNNKNRKRDREKSNPELRKMEPRDHQDVGIIDGNKIGVYGGKREKN